MSSTTGSKPISKRELYSNEELQIIKNGAGVLHITEITQRINMVSEFTRSEESVKNAGKARGFKFRLLALRYDAPHKTQYCTIEQDFIRASAGRISMEDVAYIINKVFRDSATRTAEGLKHYCNRNDISYRTSDSPQKYTPAEISIISENVGVIPLDDIVILVNDLGVFNRTREAIRSYGTKQGWKFKVKSYDY